jgi:hypothetical protein
MLDLSYKQIGPGHYVKWNDALKIRTTLKFEGDKIHVRHDQPKWVMQTILDDNVSLQNSFSRKSYKGQELYQGARIPLPVFMQLRKESGFVPGQGYDEKKFRSLLNDRDYYKLKVTPDKI